MCIEIFKKEEKLKLLVTLLAVLMLMAVSGFTATHSTEYTNSPFTDDSIYLNVTVYTPVGSLSVTQDTVGNAVYMVSGTMEMGNRAWGHLAICTDTTSAGVPQIVVGSDTTAVSLHEWWWRESVGDSKLRIPFSFNQDLDSDSTGGAIKLYLMGKVQTSVRPLILHDVRIEAITNLPDQP